MRSPNRREIRQSERVQYATVIEQADRRREDQAAQRWR
jgi:hypothetical protein